MSKTVTVPMVVLSSFEDINLLLQNTVDQFNEAISSRQTTEVEVLEQDNLTVSAGYVQSEVQELSNSIKDVADKLDVLINLLK